MCPLFSQNALIKYHILYKKSIYRVSLDWSMFTTFATQLSFPQFKKDFMIKNRLSLGNKQFFTPSSWTLKHTHLIGKGFFVNGFLYIGMRCLVWHNNYTNLHDTKRTNRYFMIYIVLMQNMLRLSVVGIVRQKWLCCGRRRALST